MTTMQPVMDEARQAAEGGPAQQFVERIAERIGAQASVKAVFGEPVDRGDLTVIPVGRVRWGFGGGAGDGGGSDGSGSGGGGGVAAEPIGFIEIGPSGAAFRPIVSPYPSPLFRSPRGSRRRWSCGRWGASSGAEPTWGQGTRANSCKVRV